MVGIVLGFMPCQSLVSGAAEVRDVEESLSSGYRQRRALRASSNHLHHSIYESASREIKIYIGRKKKPSSSQTIQFRFSNTLKGALEKSSCIMFRQNIKKELELSERFNSCTLNSSGVYCWKWLSNTCRS